MFPINRPKEERKSIFKDKQRRRELICVLRGHKYKVVGTLYGYDLYVCQRCGVNSYGGIWNNADDKR